MESYIEDEMKTELLNAKKYAEGRGIQIPVTKSTLLPDIKLLVEIKLKY